MKKKIDFEHWHRREHFLAFQSMESPHLSVCGQIDVAPIRRREGKMFPRLLHLVHQTCSEIPEFQYRIEKDLEIVQYERMDLSFNILADDGLFSNHRMSPSIDFSQFQSEVEAAVAEKSKVGVIRIDPGQDQGLIITSCLPWMTFMSLREPLMGKNDSLPRITWGKFTEEMKMPLSVTAHHGLMDGLHVALFFSKLQEKIDSL